MSERSFSFLIVSPDGRHFEDEAEILNLRLTDGAIGILKNRAPLIGIVDVCPLEYEKDGKRRYFALGGGVLEVKDNKVLILADSFESKEEIDKKRAEEAKARAEERIESYKETRDPNIDYKRAELALKKALNRLAVVDK